MGLKVMPAGEQDAARSVAIEKVAYGRNPISHIIHPAPAAAAAASDAADADADAAREEALRKNLRADPESCLWIQAVDEDRTAQGQHGMRVWGPGSNAEACELFFGGMTSKWFERMGNKPHFYLKLLHTDPAHQRRGAASMLLQHFADVADKHGLESYLESTDEGRPLYEKFGYETVEVMVTDFSKWGGPDRFETCLMLRKPKTGSS
ncbi:hypothetical protein LLEC1_07330 [Akanthomyces lecanii]|uniref:N-acetyltransferase domain-containing protein n=1 Tax=Cordyceps confragosa TaxID=2714763 RepID=A0A179HYZ5_CORDF|nr:hypothetical protein LLEC1_07330 [Akanthomyces lecanii]